MGTTGGDREKLMNDVRESGNYAVIAPQMGKQVFPRIPSSKHSLRSVGNSCEKGVLSSQTDIAGLHVVIKRVTRKAGKRGRCRQTKGTPAPHTPYSSAASLAQDGHSGASESRTLQRVGRGSPIGEGSSKSIAISVHERRVCTGPRGKASSDARRGRKGGGEKNLSH